MSPGRLSRNDECNAFHLRTRRQGSVHVVRAVAHLEMYLSHRPEKAEDRFFAFTEALLGMCPIAGSAKRLIITRSSDRN